MDAQVLIIGGGIAGGIAALGLADRGIPVVLIRPSASPEDTASFHAQGGSSIGERRRVPGPWKKTSGMRGPAAATGG